MKQARVAKNDKRGKIFENKEINFNCRIYKREERKESRMEPNQVGQDGESTIYKVKE